MRTRVGDVISRKEQGYNFQRAGMKTLRKEAVKKQYFPTLQYVPGYLRHREKKEKLINPELLKRWRNFRGEKRRATHQGTTIQIATPSWSIQDNRQGSPVRPSFVSFVGYKVSWLRFPFFFLMEYCFPQFSFIFLYLGVEFTKIQFLFFVPRQCDFVSVLSVILSLLFPSLPSKVSLSNGRMNIAISFFLYFFLSTSRLDMTLGIALFFVAAASARRLLSRRRSFSSHDDLCTVLVFSVSRWNLFDSHSSENKKARRKPKIHTRLDVFVSFAPFHRS